MRRYLSVHIWSVNASVLSCMSQTCLIHAYIWKKNIYLHFLCLKCWKMCFFPRNERFFGDKLWKFKRIRKAWLGSGKTYADGRIFLICICNNLSPLEKSCIIPTVSKGAKNLTPTYYQNIMCIIWLVMQGIGFWLLCQCTLFENLHCITA